MIPLEPKTREFVLQFHLELHEILLARLIALFFGGEAETAHLVEIPFSGFAVAESHFTADERTGASDLVNGDGNFARG